ncbi:glutamate-cysteine ligase family protein [Bailinhaonella thermotolerans]|uniref:glutamate-cysteine ligase family protein n=1 Tax=Bailinhaonella thermotolerans TaxID=1070861 RepID=UPI00192A25B8|nr:glutamate-cysteine ligase family protein [Bailinhaonella thermotolerans]
MLREEDVYAHVHGICFKTGPPGLVGVESEWLILDAERPGEHVPIARLAAAVEAARPLPAGSAVTYEPGGQLELSTRPLPGPAEARHALAADLRRLDPHLAAAGLRRTGSALDARDPLRQSTAPRYAAMEAYLDAYGPAGRAMMCSTASIQVCLDIGRDAADARRRWRLANRLGPVLLAAFANSPLWRGRPTGWRSTRQAIWQALDPTRVRPAPLGEAEPWAAWARYALDARVMAVPRDGWRVGCGLRFRDWVRSAELFPGGPSGLASAPTRDDLAFHLSTLFPPVRPRGHLELRMIDALPEPWWPVPVAVAAALIDRAPDACEEAVEPLPPGLWSQAARGGPADPRLARAARACFAAARDALSRAGDPPALGPGPPPVRGSGTSPVCGPGAPPVRDAGAPPVRDAGAPPARDAGASPSCGPGAYAELAELVDRYAERYVEPGRCPADEALDDLEGVPT